MQIMQTPSGDSVVAMTAAELLMTEQALSRYILEKPDSNLTARMLSKVSRVNEEREAQMEEEAEATSSSTS
ncbi:hypothetical protein [Streptomyces sp. NBC_01187]|uniref:hypothetical protein n=1 Tax=Streptomyces sp. NBC_01187 TaxID=2903766 RepID=UPI00386E2176|nr:hypothetical protein OG220_11705 [Streptomyces sp. NBC_01187]